MISNSYLVCTGSVYLVIRKESKAYLITYYDVTDSRSD